MNTAHEYLSNNDEDQIGCYRSAAIVVTRSTRYCKTSSTCRGSRPNVLIQARSPIEAVGYGPHMWLVCHGAFIENHVGCLLFNRFITHPVLGPHLPR